MPYITPSARHLITVKRRTSVLLATTTVAATQSVTIQPGIESCIQVLLLGDSSGAGTITIAGTVSGSAGSEVLTFADNGVQSTVKYFTAIDASGVTSSGLSDGTIEVSSVGSDGSPTFAVETIITGFPCFIEMAGLLVGAGAGAWSILRSGPHEMGTSTLYIDYQEDYIPTVGDLVTDELNSDIWLIQDSSLKMGLSLPEFYECRMTRYET